MSTPATNHRLPAGATSLARPRVGDGLPVSSPAPDARAEGAGAFLNRKRATEFQSMTR